jgi:hypothetical protein
MTDSGERRKMSSAIYGSDVKLYGAGLYCDTDYKAASDTQKKTENTVDSFKLLKEAFAEEHRLTKENIKYEDDWKEMSDEQWNKLVENIDKYIDDYKEDLEKRKELQDEAARKEAAKVPAYMRANAASSAALAAVNHGTADALETADGAAEWEKKSWTYDLDTDDQTVLATAKMANEYAHDILSKFQELALTGDTTAGISETADARECASFEENAEKEKTWTITAFTEQGIICKECTGGVSRELWRIDYQNPGDYQKVWDYLAQFDKDGDFKFAEDKSFWEDFLQSKSAETQ